MVRRSAFTLIELIFAIVVIAISVVSLPMMTQVTAKGTDANLVQEGVFAAAAELNEAVTAHWDENSLEPGFPFTLSRVIDLGLCGNDSNAANYRRMPGHIDQEKHRRCLDSPATAPTNVNDVNVTSLSDMINLTPRNVFDDTTTNSTGYKKGYFSTIDVQPNASFGTTANNPYIKSLVSTITDSAGDTIVLLRTYSANIGEIDYYKKEY